MAPIEHALSATNSSLESGGSIAQHPLSNLTWLQNTKVASAWNTVRSRIKQGVCTSQKPVVHSF
jgi:hypothetical protein